METDDSEYLTIEEFADLPSAAQHAVWAPDSGIDTIQVGGGGGIRRWHRAQVAGLLEAASEVRA